MNINSNNNNSEFIFLTTSPDNKNTQELQSSQPTAVQSQEKATKAAEIIGAGKTETSIPVSRQSFQSMESRPPSNQNSLDQAQAIPFVKDVNQLLSQQSPGESIFVAGQFDVPQFLEEKVKEPSRLEQNQILLKDLNEAVAAQNKEKFKDILNANKKEASWLVEHLLEQQSQSNLLRTMDKNELKDSESYRFILQQVQELFPVTQKYFQSNDTKFGLYHSLLTPEGMRLIVNDLKEKGAFGDMECIVCDAIRPYNDSNNKDVIFITELTEKMQTLEVGQRCCFLVRHYNNDMPGAYRNNPNSMHVTPVYLEKTEQGLDLFITDSTGGSLGQGHLLAMFLERSIPKDLLKTTDLYIYSGNCRQADTSNCPIFSIRDTVKFGKYRKEVVQQIKENVDQEIPASTNPTSPPEFKKTFIFKILPKEMMNTFQVGLKPIDTYKDKKGNPIKIDLKLHRVANKENKEMNTRVADHFFKYERSIYHKVIAQAVESELEKAGQT